MKKLFVTLLLPILFSGCVGNADLAFFDDDNFGIRFSHPSEWGTWSLSDIPSQPNTDAISEMTFSVLSNNIRYLQSGKANVDVVFRRYDADQYRFEEVCESIVDLCDSMRQQDLLQEKDAFAKVATHAIDGVPATIMDYYDVPSGYVGRKVRFYTPTHRADIIAAYDIGDFLQTKGPNDSSLSETAHRILTDDLSDPIYRLSQSYPDELKEMTEFYADVDRFLASIKISK